MKHQWLKYYNVYINHDPAMPMTQFMARSPWVVNAFEWEKLLTCYLKGKTSRKLANGQKIDYSEKKNGPRGFICPALALNTIIFKHVYWYMQQISGEHLQDHWSSGLLIFLVRMMKNLEKPPENQTLHPQPACLVSYLPKAFC